MTKDCSTCVHKEGSCYPSTTIFDKDKTCKSYIPDYEGYIAELEKENAELKAFINAPLIKGRRTTRKEFYQTIWDLSGQLTKAKEFLNEFMRISKASDEDFEHDYSELIGEAEQFSKDSEEK